jgi:RNase H-fold protein (predicted Holliday junction resolvase)
MQALRPLRSCRILAVDPGITFIGLAVRINRLQGARPYGLIERERHRRGSDWSWTLQRSNNFGRTRPRFDSPESALAHVIAEQRLTAVVFGMPYYADGSDSPQSAAAERQAASLQSMCRIPVLLWDETFSTQMAVGPGRKPAARKSHADAACLILEEVLSSLLPLEVDDYDEELR